MDKALLYLFLFSSFSLQAWCSPCLEAYKRVAIENRASRNDEKIALEMLYAEDSLSIIKSESYYFINNAIKDLANDKIKTSFSELQAHIYAGFLSGEFCKDTKPRKSAGQIIRIAKSQVKDMRYEERGIAKIFLPAPPKSIADSLSFDSQRKPSGRVTQKQ
ncbi:MAG: hypothetical protein ACOYL6_06630 [Bacteriovoracaceae bacterium]